MTTLVKGVFYIMVSFSYQYTGPHAGEMMMSVLWYYRPEQTEMGMQPHIHGEVQRSETSLIHESLISFCGHCREQVIFTDKKWS